MSTGRSLAIACCSLSAALLCTWMSYAKGAGKTLPGCGGDDDDESGCDAALASRWSRWLGIPVTLPAAVTYAVLETAALITAYGTSPSLRREASVVVFALAVLAAASAVWFSGLQFIVVLRWCRYCLSLHAIAVAVFLLALDPGVVSAARHAEVAVSLTAGLGFLALVGGQILVRPKVYSVDATTPPPVGPAEPNPAPKPSLTFLIRRSGRRADFMSGRVSLDVDQWPILGDRQGTALIAYLFDYTCPTCRKGHRSLVEAIGLLGGSVSAVLVPAPVDPTCNPHVTRQHAAHAFACRFARLGLDVWRRDPGAFAAFDEWVFETPEPPAIGLAVAEARRLTEAEDIDPAVPDPDLDRSIAAGVAAYRDSKAGQMPALLFRDAIVRGELPPAAELARLIRGQASTVRAAESEPQPLNT